MKRIEIEESTNFISPTKFHTLYLSAGQFSSSMRLSSNSMPPYESSIRIGSPNPGLLKYVSLYFGFVDGCFAIFGFKYL